MNKKNEPIAYRIGRLCRLIENTVAKSRDEKMKFKRMHYNIANHVIPTMCKYFEFYFDSGLASFETNVMIGRLLDFSPEEIPGKLTNDDQMYFWFGYYSGKKFCFDGE